MATDGMMDALPGNVAARAPIHRLFYVTTSTRPPARGRAPLTTRFAPAFRYHVPGLDTTSARGCGLTRALPPLQRSSTSILPVTSLYKFLSGRPRAATASAHSRLAHGQQQKGRTKWCDRPVLGAPRPVARMPRTGGAGAERLRTLSSGGESLLRTLSGSRRAATCGDEPEN
jgi:hypothetical protein